MGVVIALGAVDLALPRDARGASSRRSCARARALAVPGTRHLASRPGTGSHPRCLLAGRPAHRARTGEKYRLKRPLPAAGPARGTVDHTDGVKTSHPVSRKAAHGLNSPARHLRRDRGNTPWAPLPHPTRPPPCAGTRSKTLSPLGTPATTTTTSQTSRPRLARCSRPRLLPPPAENQGRLRPQPGHHLRPPRPAGPAVTTPRPAVQATRIPRTTDHRRPATDVNDHGR